MLPSIKNDVTFGVKSTVSSYRSPAKLQEGKKYILSPKHGNIPRAVTIIENDLVANDNDSIPLRKLNFRLRRPRASINVYGTPSRLRQP